MSKPLYVAPGRGIAARRLGDEMMIMSGRDSTLFTLNEVATVIWEAADGSKTLDDIVKSVVCREFEIDLDLALRDAETLAKELAGHGILLLSEDPLTSAPRTAMTSLMQEMNAKALELQIPLGVQLDLTYRCNEQCVHCYLDHADHGEMTTLEIKALLDQLAAAGVFFLTLSGGEILLRKDFFEILEYARAALFCVRLKTNAVLIRERQAERIRALGVHSVQISIYSHRPEVHDSITKVPGSLKRSVAAIRLLKARGLKVIIADVLMLQNMQDYPGVRALAAELGVEFTIDPTITPKMDGDRSILKLNVDTTALERIFRDEMLVGDVEEFCGSPKLADESDLDSLPCSAGHSSCYVSPYGDVYPCVQFPLPSGNVRRTPFLEIWRHSEQLNDVRGITVRDLPSCSQCVHVAGCSRCPGLAYMEGNMRGPSSQDCEKSFVRTGIPSKNLQSRKSAISPLVQIQGASTIGHVPSSDFIGAPHAAV